ncbi:hypothetical protein PBI_EGAD_79 [Arthrobacter phage Egad]|nr:hypothetical protein PBI_EGAD_79 [Arthrobacter phage Egad]UVT31155.1 hypothetical protein PBI_LINDA_79 [Arthrobacter phage Linda]
MKLLMFILTGAFSIAMFIRIIEMSVAFDWVDVGWTFIFLFCTLITGGVFSSIKERVGDAW